MCLKKQTRYSPAYLNRNNYLNNQDCPSSDRPMFGGGIVFFSKNIWFSSHLIVPLTKVEGTHIRKKK